MSSDFFRFGDPMGKDREATHFNLLRVTADSLSVGDKRFKIRVELHVRMPVWEKAGDPTQLGGEFVLRPGMTASYAHRMRSRSSHAPIVRVLTAAGVHVYLRSEKPKSVISSDPAGQASLVLEVDEEQWMEE
ncbi:uncharacterized protein F5891DRAFT_984587 [Suillus fuscotomentosus]|uniref:Uncharacterized protein n=1 Tax=Suillus fuscotomentosus TaxID=1912939 RepID=A0AAD4HFT7_9AGAM|nr:uncharacterized protein F5891DRAFT_984587 [Suillus fuscotomentosus]KAG1895003.1 hypothetical protein F5891DRAFT_984587 [Suillus fuscotomentosus]